MSISPGKNGRTILLGEHRRGKSSLANALIGFDVCDIWDTVITRLPYVVSYGESVSAHLVISPRPGSGNPQTRVPLPSVELRHRSVTMEDPWFTACGERAIIERTAPSPALAGKGVLVDMVGVSDQQTDSPRIVLSGLGPDDLVIWVSDASRAFSSLEIDLLEEVVSSECMLVCVVTKTDLFIDWPKVATQNSLVLGSLGSKAKVIPLSITRDEDLGATVAVTADSYETVDLGWLRSKASGRVARPAKRKSRPLRSSVNAYDVVSLVATNLRARSLRTLLSALGIAIGIAGAVAVLGISASSKADALAELDRLGTNVLRVDAGAHLLEDKSGLSDGSPGRISRIPAVEGTTALVTIDERAVRNEFVSEGRTQGTTVRSVDQFLLEVLKGDVAVGSFLSAGDLSLPISVLGSKAAERFGITEIKHRPVIIVGGERVIVSGVLNPFTLHPDLDRSVFIGRSFADDHFAAGLRPDTIHVRVDPTYVEAVADLLPRTAEPTDPGSVGVTRPSDGLAARAVIDETLKRLVFGLAAVALLVGGFGIANITAVAVVERRAEIGVHLALGARPVHIGSQVVAESALLSLLGGAIGISIGLAATALYATLTGLPLIWPGTIVAVGLLAAAAIGAMSGVIPALRAAGTDPAAIVRAQ